MKRFVFPMAFIIVLLNSSLSEALSIMRLKDVYTYNVGSVKVSMLSERQGRGNTDILIGATPEMIAKIAPDKEYPNAINIFLVQTGVENILVDTGFGLKLEEHLKHFKLEPKDIHSVLITHMHRDHIGGLLKDGKQRFPNAKVYLDKNEYAYWMDDPQRKASVEHVVNAYKDKLHLFTAGDLNGKSQKLFPEVSAIAAYGHTPGHTVYMIESKGEKLLIWGDLTHAMAFQMPYPKVSVTYDVSSSKAAQTREQILRYVSENKISVAGMHIAFPGMGKVSSDAKGGYIFKPLP